MLYIIETMVSSYQCYIYLLTMLSTYHFPELQKSLFFINKNQLIFPYCYLFIYAISIPK